jgi:hypothetical protein
MKKAFIIICVLFFAGTSSATDYTGSTTGAELDYVHGVTSAIQDQLDAKQVALTNPLVAAGTQALTDNWDVGSFQIRAETFQSDVATGTAPLTIASETVVPHLNVSYLEGHAASYFQTALTNPLVQTDVDDTPVNGVTTAPVSSNWAYDHVAAADPHTGYMLESNIGTGANNYVQLNGSGQLPALSAANLTNFPTLNQNTTGTAAGLTSQYIDWDASSGGNSIANKPTIPTASSLSVDDLITLSGVSGGAQDLGTFTGATINDNVTIKVALQSLETAVEGVGGGHDPVTLSTDLGNNLLGLSTQQLTLDDQTANYVFAGPTSGGAAAPAFRALVSADIPNNAADTSGNAATATVAANLSGTPALPNGVTATTQSASDNSTKLATTAYVDAAAGAPTNITPVDTADEDATFYPVLVDGPTGSQATETDGELTYNPSTGVLTTPQMSAGAGGFTVDDDGDTTVKSITQAKSSGVAGYQGFYEANSTDTDYIGPMGPASISESYLRQFSDSQPAGSFSLWGAPAGSGGPNGEKVSAETLVTPATGVTTAMAATLNGAGGLMTPDGTATLTNKTLDANGTGNALSNVDDGNMTAAAATKLNRYHQTAHINPDYVYDNEGYVEMDGLTAADITLDRLYVRLNEDPTTELTFTCYQKTAGVDHTSPTTIGSGDTVSGVLNFAVDQCTDTDTPFTGCTGSGTGSIFTDATVPAGSMIWCAVGTDPGATTVGAALVVNGSYD